MADGSFGFASPETWHHVANLPAFAPGESRIFRIHLGTRQAKRAGRVGRS
jgi:hypothetical protein